MAVLSDVIGRGYSTGREIGDDISRVRFQRGEERVREKYAALAAEEGKPLRDYMPQIEQEITALGQGMFGADRRGVIGADRQSLSAGALGRLQGDVLRAGEREAGALAMQGNQMGARQERARTLYGMGRFDDGQAQQIAGDTIGATAASVGPDGVYDPAKGALAMSGVNAQYGDQAGAERNATAGKSFRMDSANAIAGNLATMFQNPANYSALTRACERSCRTCLATPTCRWATTACGTSMPTAPRRRRGRLTRRKRVTRPSCWTCCRASPVTRRR